jgi:beta-galactosidase
MENVPYSVDLPRSNATVLILSGKTLGVGSAACGPRPLPEYRLDSSPRTFSYVLRLGRNAAPQALPNRGTDPILVERGPDGRTALVASTPIETSLDGTNWQPYRTPMTVTGSTRISVRTTGFQSVIALEPPPAKLAWKAMASDFENGEGNPERAIDNDPSTFWHSRYSPTAQGLPHSLTLDFTKVQRVGSILLTPRQDGNDHGRIRDYAIYLSDDGKSWGEPVAKGTLRNSENRATIRLDRSREARYLRLVVLGEHSNGGYASLAELDVEP